MPVSAFTDKKALQLFDDEKRDDADEDAQADRHVMAVALSAPTVGMPLCFMCVVVASAAVAMSVPLLSSESIDRTVQTDKCEISVRVGRKARPENRSYFVRSTELYASLRHNCVRDQVEKRVT